MRSNMQKKFELYELIDELCKLSGSTERAALLKLDKLEKNIFNVSNDFDKSYQNYRTWKHRNIKR